MSSDIALGVLEQMKRKTHQISLVGDIGARSEIMASDFSGDKVMGQLGSESSNSQADTSTSAQPQITPVRCFTGALISAPMAYALYLLTVSISETFAAKPMTSSSMLAIRISIMVRTLVMGMSALGTTIFAFTTLGVTALGIQLLFKSWRSPRENES